MTENPYLIGLGEMNLAELVHVISIAHKDASELIELEWKIHWDFKPTNPKRAELAKHIVAMANRDPDQSARVFAGHAYIVIGVEPGNLRGIDAIDPADVDQMLRPFVGSQINWHSVNVEFSGKNVLVIVVDPPLWGDPIHELLKSSEDPATGEKFEKRTIYVRRPGTSVPADESEKERLRKRLNTRRPRVSVAAKWNSGQSGRYVAVAVANEPQGLTARIEEIGFTLDQQTKLSEVENPEDDSEVLSGFASFPFDVGRYELLPGETHDFRIHLNFVPEIIELDTELYPYCYHSGGHWIVGAPITLQGIADDGWEPPTEGQSTFPVLRFDAVYPIEKRGVWTTMMMPGWEDVQVLPSFYPVDDNWRRRLRRRILRRRASRIDARQ